MKQQIRRAALFALTGALITASACDRASEEAPEGAADFGDPVDGGTAVIAVGADMSIPIMAVAQGTLDGYLGADIMFMSLLKGIWDGSRLVYRTAGDSPMALARSVEFVGADSTALRFHLRSDVKWSDGEPISAEDVVYSFEMLGDPALASPIQPLTELFSDVVAEDDSTVVVLASRPSPDMISSAGSIPILPSHIFAGTSGGDFRNHPAARNPEQLVVSRPYRISDWEQGSSITLSRNPEFVPAGHLDQIVFRIIPEQLTRQIELQTGAVDFALSLSLDQLPMLREQAPDVRLEVEEKRFYEFVVYNGGSFEPLRDEEIRLALTMATDRAGIIEALQMSDHATVAGGHYPPIFQDLYDPEGQAPPPFDREGARRTFAGKGWTDSDGDGVLDRDGEDFSFTLLTNTGNQRRADVAQILQQQWSEVGVEVEIRAVEFNTLNEMLLRGDFEASLYGWSVGLIPDLTPVWSIQSPFNFARYRNSEAADLMEQARSQASYEAAAPFWRDAASMISQDQPYTWLFFLDSVDGVNNRLRDTEVSTAGPFQNVWEWWIPEEMRNR